MKNKERLDVWAAESQAARTLLGVPGIARPDQTIGLSGMQILTGISSGQLPQPPMGDTLDFIPIRIEHGRAIFEGQPKAKHYNPMGTVHGGWIAAVLDSALGCAIHSTLAAGKGYTTLELKINFVRALTDVVQTVRAEGTVIHAGRQVATSEARLTGPDDKLYAHATTTCLIFDAQ